MFSAVAHKKLSSAEGYFAEHLSQNDYYAAGEIRPGQWIGIGTERLGMLVGEHVTREQFYALCENKHPQSGEQLTPRQQKEDKRRVFYDFTCSAPKSVSVLAVALDDHRLIEAHQEAARLAFRELETFAAARVRKQNSQGDRTTGNLVAATFLHTSSRALDPLLHSHFTVFNATFDPQEHCWKALQAGAMYDAIRYGTAVYRNELARRVHEIGYHTIPAKHGFEIEGVSESVLRLFSKRSQERDQEVSRMEQQLGRKLSNNEIAYAVHRTRPGKVKGISSAEVRERQQAQLSIEELQSLRALTTAASTPVTVVREECGQEALSHATAHVFERQSVVPQHELLAVALSYRPGGADLLWLKQRLEQAPDLVRTESGISTRQILETELLLIQTVDSGRDQLAPLSAAYQAADWLTDDQRRALLHVLNSGDRIIGLRGLAGTGKTTALRVLAKACHGAGTVPLFCAPTASATDILRKEGFEAVTLQSLLAFNRPLSKSNVVVVDEASAIGIDDMKRLFEQAKDCRIVLSGDTGQHASVARGDALRILEQHSSLQSTQLTRIRRQRRAEYRKAVELAAQKRNAESFAQLERTQAITELSPHELHASAAEAYVKALRSGKSALLIAPTWVEIGSITGCVREALKQQALIGAEEHSFPVFEPLKWTEAQKRDSRQYRSGMSLCFHQSHDGFTPGESVEVLSVGTNTLAVRRLNGSAKEIKLSRERASFEVGETRDLKVAAGDRLLLRANREKRFTNGELVTVKAVENGNILLTDERILPADYRNFTHGHAVTSHAAQGKTVDEVFVVSSARSLPAVSQAHFYVSISRGRDRCQIFTDDKESLRSHVTRSSIRTAAVETLRHPVRLKQTLLQRILRWAEHVSDLIRLNHGHRQKHRTPASQRVSFAKTVSHKPYGNSTHGISV